MLRTLVWGDRRLLHLVVPRVWNGQPCGIYGFSPELRHVYGGNAQTPFPLGLSYSVGNVLVHVGDVICPACASTVEIGFLLPGLQSLEASKL